MLVIDDVEVNRASLRAIFEEEYKIIEAADGNAAILMLQKEAVDLVILDLCMPGMDGTEVLRWIRSSKRHKHIPVIVKTAIDETIEEEILEAGADGLYLFALQSVNYPESCQKYCTQVYL